MSCVLQNVPHAMFMMNYDHKMFIKVHEKNTDVHVKFM